jgi:hypothetical protein
VHELANGGDRVASLVAGRLDAALEALSEELAEPSCSALAG